MGLLDQMLGGVLNQALNGQQAQNGQSQAQQGQAGIPLTDLLGSLFGAGLQDNPLRLVGKRHRGLGLHWPLCNRAVDCRHCWASCSRAAWARKRLLG